MSIDLDPNAFYFKIYNPGVKAPMKFTDCDCELISVDNGNCIVKACEKHTLSIKDGGLKHISPFVEPAFPITVDAETHAKFTSALKAIAELGDMRAKLQYENDQLQEQLKEANANVEALHEIKDKQEHEIKNLKQRISNLDYSIGLYTDKFFDQQEKIIELQCKVNTLEADKLV